jgi:glycosyltransferase involved in cell wall biosynthesis
MPNLCSPLLNGLEAPAKALRVAVICDLREEGWHSMDLIADMLLEALPGVPGGNVVATGLCPRMVPRCSRLPLVGGSSRARLGDRLIGRLWDYPRWLAPRISDFDVFHIVDHSYAHLVQTLPAERTIVTCNDVDAIRAALPVARHRFGPASLLASGILKGLSRAAHVACISEATKADLLATSVVRPDRVSVIPLGVHPSCSQAPAPRWDAEIDRLVGPPGVEVLHVGSTIPRKRIDVLLRVIAGVRSKIGSIRLIHVGGSFTPAQRKLAASLGLESAIVELPFLERPLLAALYRRAAVLVLPSDSEGFGLPVVEAMACGTPVLASALPALRETGGSAAIYCPPGDVEHWAETLTTLLRQREADPTTWASRQTASIVEASRFDWTAYAANMAALYHATGRTRSALA